MCIYSGVTYHILVWLNAFWKQIIEKRWNLLMIKYNTEQYIKTKQYKIAYRLNENGKVASISSSKAHILRKKKWESWSNAENTSFEVEKKSEYGLLQFIKLTSGMTLNKLITLCFETYVFVNDDNHNF